MPICVSDFGKSNFCSFLHPEKVPLSIHFTPEGNAISNKFSQLAKANFPITLIESVIDTSFNYADMLEDYVEGEEEGINVDSGEWYTGDEPDKDDWDEEDYEYASKFDEQ